MNLPPQHLAEILAVLKASAGEVPVGEKHHVARMEVQAAVPAAPLVHGTPGRPSMVLTQHISFHGIAILTSFDMQPGDEFVVRLPRHPNPLLVVCQVLHCRELADGIFGVGAEFRTLMSGDIGPLDKSREVQLKRIRDSILA